MAGVTRETRKGRKGRKWREEGKREKRRREKMEERKDERKGRGVKSGEEKRIASAGYFSVGPFQPRIPFCRL